MLSCSIWFSASSFWMGGGLESYCVGRVYGADGAVGLHVARHHPHRTHNCQLSRIATAELQNIKSQKSEALIYAVVETSIHARYLK